MNSPYGSPYGANDFRPNGYGSYPQGSHSQGAFGSGQPGHGQTSPTNNQALNAWLQGLSAPPQLQVRDQQGLHTQLANQDAQHRLEKYRPTKPKKIAAWIGAGIGGLMLFSVFLPSEGTPFIQSALTSLTMAVMFGVPGGYWLWRNHEDQKLVRNWTQANVAYRRDLGWIRPQDAHLFPEPDQVPVLPKRRWLAIWAAVIVALVVFSVVSPDTTDPIAPQTSVPRTQY